MSFKEAGEAVGEREGREHKKAVGGDALQGIDLIAAKAAAEFQVVMTANPVERAGDVEGVLERVARPRDGIAHGSIASDLDEGRASRVR